jgi:hypothetical protein
MSIILNALIATLGSTSEDPGATVTIVNRTITYVQFGASATASVTFKNDGTTSSVFSSGTGYSTDWIDPTSAAPDDYQIRATISSGTMTSGTFGSWLALTSNRTWSKTQFSVGSSSAQVLFEIRKGSGSVLDSGTITFYVERVS